MPAIPLPAGIEEKLDEVAVEVRRLRVLRGVSWFAAVLFSLPVALVVADAALDLSAPLRGLVLAGGLVLLAAAFWLLVLRRSRGPVPAEQLAAAVEEHHPNLAERLRTLVELSENADPGNGSRAMIALLAKETEKRAKRLNFLTAAPIGFSLRLAAFAVLVAVAAVSPLFLVKGSTERVRRALLPWWTPPVDVPYAVKVSSGDPVVKRGEPVTLSAYLERTRPAGDLPTDATLVVRTPGQKDEKRLPMSGDDKAAFTVTRPKVDADFEYRVESGPAASEWHTVAAVDAVEVADGTAIVITAPAYARDTVPDVTKDGLSEIEALQHSTAEFTVKLTRAPADVQLEFRPADARPDQLPANLSAKLRYSGDRKTITAAVPLAADGTLKLALFGEKGVRTDVPVAVKAVPDKAPEFEKVVGVPADKRQVKPDAVLPFEVAVTDDVAVGKAFVDLARADGPDVPFHSEPFPLPAGQRRGEGKAGFALAGRVKLGETVRLRLRVQDTRDVPENGLTPNEVTYPAGGWATLTVVADARPVAEQDIAAQKAQIADLLAQATAKTKTAAEEVPQQAKRWADEKLDDVKAAEVGVNRSRANQAAQWLKELAKEAEVVPELRPLAAAARDLAENELATAEDELRKAGTETDLRKRNEAFDKAGKALAGAVDKLNRLRQKNDDTAAGRLARSRLEQLAEEQRRLAEEAAKADPRQLKELQDKQKELNDRLAELTKESDALRKAKEEADRKRANELADDLKKLADRQRELDDAVNKSADAARREQLDELKKLQKELNDKAAKLGSKTDPAARMGETKPLERKPFDAALDKLEQKNALDAMSEQEKAARELDRLADALADQVKGRGDAKAAAEQIARWQKDLNRRAADAAAQNPNGVPKAEKDKLAAEQQAIRKATERLKLPPADGVETARTAAADTADAAAEKLKRDVGKADSTMKKAADALDDLARKTPSNKERNAAARAEVDKLRREQEKIQQQAEDAARAVKQNPDDKAARDELAKKLGEAAAKQDELAKKLKQLDTPGLEDRRDRAARAGERAAGDMKAGLPQDVPASQADARRQLDRLKDALDGKTPADDKATELARLQNELTRNLTQPQKPEELQRLQRQQQDIADQLSKLQAPEAAGELADAQSAAREAAKAAQKEAAKPNPDADELRKKSKDAADKLDKLADRMGGEPDAQKRLDRIAENRQAEADKAKDAEASRADMSRSREAQKQAERDLNDLNDTRTGQAQAAKKKLQEALDRLNKADEPDKAKDLQQQAADAAKKLADAVRKNSDRKGDGDQKAQKAGQDPADATDPNNALPTAQDVAQARELAKQQRELKNDVAKAQEKAAKGQPMPQPNGDPLGDLAKQQDELAKQAGELAQQAEQKGDPAGQKAKEAADAARQAAEKMAAGDPSAGQKAGGDAAQKMRDAAAAAGDAATKTKADDLAKKQDELNQKAGQATPGDAQARQQNRQKELAQEAGKMADRLAKEAGEADDGSKAAKGLDKAADGAKEAQKQMEQAARTGQGGKPKDAADARRQAERALDDAAREARGDGQPQDGKGDGQPQGGKGGQQPGGNGGQPQDGPGDGQKGGQPQDAKGGQPKDGKGQGEGGGGGADANAKAAADAVKQADGKQKQAGGQMGKADAKGAAEAGKQAADKIQEAADLLAKSGQEQGQGQGEGQGQGQGQGDGESGQPGSGQGGKPGLGAGGAKSGDLPSVVRDNLGKSWGELPGDVKAKITAELKAKYGEDYARVIKLYFEQLAERK